MTIGDLSITNFIVGEDQVEKLCLGLETVWEREGGDPPVPPEPAYSAMPLTFEVISAGTITWLRYGGSSSGARTIEYSKDDGSTWSSITSNTSSSAPTITVAAGDKVQFRGNNKKYFDGITSNRFITNADCRFRAYGNIMSLVDSTGTQADLTSANTEVFQSLFENCSALTDAGNLIMPASTQHSCYNRMFGNCVNLATAPVLPAAALMPFAYQYMFDGCSSLNYIKCLATNISAKNCVANWTNNVASTGTFVKDATMTAWPVSRSGIPSNWTVKDA